jgi:hypothetical protein
METCRQVGRGLVDKSRAVGRGRGEKGSFGERLNDLSTSRTRDLSTSLGPWGGLGNCPKVGAEMETCRQVGRGLVDKSRAVGRGWGEKGIFGKRL